MTPQLFIAVSGVFIAVAVIAGSATSWWLVRTAPEKRRLRNLAWKATRSVPEAQPLAEGPDPKLARLTRLMPRSPKDMSRLQRRLARAGYPQFQSVIVYSAAELV